MGIKIDVTRKEELETPIYRKDYTYAEIFYRSSYYKFTDDLVFTIEFKCSLPEGSNFRDQFEVKISEESFSERRWEGEFLVSDKYECTEEEFKFRKQRNDPFLVGILSGSRVMIIGDEEGLLA